MPSTNSRPRFAPRTHALAGTFLLVGSLAGLAGACPSVESDCCHAHDAIGCEDASCTSAVCAYDPACCDRGWDHLCADEARHLCGPICADGCSVACDGDFDGTNTVDARDLSILLSEWHQLGRCSDLDKNGSTGPEDIAYLIALWGGC